MLKKTILAVALLLPFTAQAQEVKKTNVAGALSWTERVSWSLSAKPLDLVHSLDNKKVFILTADNKVHIFAADGGKLGEMPVEADTVAIDIAPRGEMLYLINGRTNSFTAMDIGFSQQIDITGAPVRDPGGVLRLRVSLVRQAGAAARPGPGRQPGNGAGCLQAPAPAHARPG
jgi:hypothetical protein